MAARRRWGRPPRSVRCAGWPPPRSLERRLLTRSAHSGSPSPPSFSLVNHAGGAGTTGVPGRLSTGSGSRAPPGLAVPSRDTLPLAVPCREAVPSPYRRTASPPRSSVDQSNPPACPLHGASPAPSRPAVHPPARSRRAEPPPRVHRRPQNRRRRPRARKRAGTTRGAAKISERRGCGSAGRADRGRAGAARAPSASAVAGSERLRTPFGLRVVRSAAGTGRSRRGASPRRRCCGGAGSSGKEQLVSRRTNDNLCITAA